MRRRARGFALAWPLALLALYAIQPSGAFDSAASGARSVSASVVSDADAYTAVTGGSCVVPPTGGSCAITITNKGDTPLSITVSLQQDASDAIGLYDVGGGTRVSSGSTSTPGEVAVGSSTTLTADVNGCHCGSRAASWTIQGSKAGVLNTEVQRYPMTID